MARFVDSVFHRRRLKFAMRCRWMMRAIGGVALGTTPAPAASATAPALFVAFSLLLCWGAFAVRRLMACSGGDLLLTFGVVLLVVVGSVFGLKCARFVRPRLLPIVERLRLTVAAAASAASAPALSPPALPISLGGTAALMMRRAGGSNLARLRNRLFGLDDVHVLAVRSWSLETRLQPKLRRSSAAAAVRGLRSARSRNFRPSWSASARS